MELILIRSTTTGGDISDPLATILHKYNLPLKNLMPVTLSMANKSYKGYK